MKIINDVLGELKFMKIINDVLGELKFALTLFPEWPDDQFRALAILGEEYGELQKAVLQHHCEPSKCVTQDDIRSEAVQVAAMAIRFLISLDSQLYDGIDLSWPRHKQRGVRNEI